MINAFAGGILLDKSLAVKIGEILCEGHYGDLQQQVPLLATDKGSYWRIEGSRNRDGAVNGPAEFFISIEKSDGQVVDFGEFVRCPPHPLVVQAISDGPKDHEFDKAPMVSTISPLSEGTGNDQSSEVSSGAGMMFLTRLARGGVVFDGDLAAKIAEALCNAHYDDGYRQSPMVTVDKGEYWRVEGNWNRSVNVTTGSGRFFASIEKYDGRVIEFGE